MSQLPQTTRAPPPKGILLKVHAVSIQYRDLFFAEGMYPQGQKGNPVPGSDMAGEIIAVGEDVKGWNVGERVSSNFADSSQSTTASVARSRRRSRRPAWRTHRWYADQ
ncbi:chaperonin 10-like protein [Ganoderma leucocontextum]|nr:chaperonin 10-like protein [Ganoderma leucocontextum]